MGKESRLKQKRYPLGVSITDEHVAIADTKGLLLKWTKEEWTEAPLIVTAIATAFYLAGQGIDLRKSMELAYAEQLRLEATGESPLAAIEQVAAGVSEPSVVPQ